MKLSLNWLKEYVKLPSNITPQQIMYDLTMSTVEVEHVQDLSKDFNKICVGKILKVEKHPDADRLKIVTTDLGKDLGVKEIVCGGSNLAEAMLVAVSLPGALVRWHGEGDLVEVKETKIRGKSSFGMICASEEIGLSNLFPAKEEAEIIDLSGFEAAAGSPLAEVLEFNDFILEIDNKSLSNRPDLWGHLGIARELSAIYNAEFTLPKTKELNSSPTTEVSVNIQNPSDCRRYIGLVLNNVTNGQSPFWLKSKLARVGQRPISLLVDLTNLVMLSVGQPTHVFDQEKIKGNEINIRQSKSGEELELLDGSKIKLEEDSLVIADQNSPLALAGVMGGALSGVSATTKQIIFESANFDFVKIRKAVAKYGIRSESSMRFEKAQDPENAKLAARLFIDLLQQLQPAAQLLTVSDNYAKPIEKIEITISNEFLSSRLGEAPQPEFVTSKLTALGFTVEARSEGYQITVPSHRATGDVSIKEDIIEEVARMIGYDNLRYSPITVELTKAVRQPEYLLERSIREYLVLEAKLVEIVSYPWVNQTYLKACGSKVDELVNLMESPGTDTAALREELTPCLLEAIGKNCNTYSNFGVFEAGLVFNKALQAFSSKSQQELLPLQKKHLGLALAGEDQSAVFFELKLILEKIFSKLNLTLEFESSENLKLHNQGALSIKVQGQTLGYIAIPSPKVLQAFAIKRVKVAVAELNLTDLRKLTSQPKPYQPLPKLPVVDFDLAVVFDQAVTWQAIEKVIKESNKLIKQVKFMDLYQGEQVPTGKKSIAFSMQIVPQDKTLTSEEISQIYNKVLKNLSKSLGGELRGS